MRARLLTAAAVRPMAAHSVATEAKARKPRLQGPYPCSTELVALLRTGCCVSKQLELTTLAAMEQAMSKEWPAQLDKAANEHGWSEKNLKKKYGEQQWTVEVAKCARVELKRLWPHFKTLQNWCLNVANPIYQQFLQLADVQSDPCAINKLHLQLFMLRILWLQHKLKGCTQHSVR